MKHTDLYNKYKELDALEREELKAAVMAHGGEYVFDDNIYPSILGSFKHCNTEEYIVSKVKVDKDGVLSIYGRPVEYWEDGVDEITYIEFGHIGFITGLIPKTDEVEDVSIKKTFPTHIAFGTELVRAIENGDIGELEEVAGHCIFNLYQKHEWSTEAEAEAYLQGVYDMDGWNEFCDLSETCSDDKKFIDILNKIYDDKKRNI